MFLTRDVVFLTRDVAFLTRDDVFLTRDVVFLTREVVFLTRDVVFWAITELGWKRPHPLPPEETGQALLLPFDSAQGDEGRGANV